MPGSTHANIEYIKLCIMFFVTKIVYSCFKLHIGVLLYFRLGWISVLNARICFELEFTHTSSKAR